ncbi:hypothetical protein CJF42_24000 [Pseudoalteromonas sp. NBT06-2]|uniref:replication initiation factor domain-containing protein n=1 Tax=Pseudoalteromonas sp. NBT06-2 TaxID=2025950 RepID=UPI000BA7A8C2|nr:replication initiation factor domain-containing protein [Pseudoalteromonas sp. NBT06-2]PAJ71938.1 hypothetical protein CJF42_24000 [Pseudoalteromonas sp. NBT06-2]
MRINVKNFSDTQPLITTKPTTVTSKVLNQLFHQGSDEINIDQTAATDCHYLDQHKVKSRIDYLTIQFTQLTKAGFEKVKLLLSTWLSKNEILITATKPNLKHFSHGQMLKTKELFKSYCGAFKWHRDKQILQLELTGTGCELINISSNYFSTLKELAKSYKYIIRRVDIAVDDQTSKYGIRFAQQAYSRGLYDSLNGKRPIKEATRSNTGRTESIGSRNSYKQLKVYEKGKQLGLPTTDSSYQNWTRHEVTYWGRSNHYIEIDILFNPDPYFVAAYPKAHKRILKGVEPRSIKREIIKRFDNCLAKKLAYAKRQVGPTIHFALQKMSPDEVINKINRKSKNNQLNYPELVLKGE